MSTRTYELMFIVDPDLDEAKHEALLQRVHRYLKEGEGTVIRTEDWGMRHLAYPIQHKRDGHYYLMYFAMPPANVKQFERNILLAEGILREIIVRTEQVPAQPEAAAEEAAPAAEAAPAEVPAEPSSAEAASAPAEETGATSEAA